MKDKGGHGSDKHGMANPATTGNHQRGVLRVGRPYKVQELALDTQIGAPWRTVKAVGNRTVAEKIAMGMRADKGYVRVR
jgi:hypothetical protein